MQRKRVIISNDLLENDFPNYIEILTDKQGIYGICATRAKQKVAAMKKSLKKLGMYYNCCPICNKRDLGQVFDSSNNPLRPNLKVYRYSDASGYQWNFVFEEFCDRVVITKMIGGNMVRESTSRTIRLTESQLHGLIQDALKLILKDIAS